MIIRIRELTSDDWQEYWRLRLKALKNHPEAFGAAYEDYAAKSEEELREHLTNVYLSPADRNTIFGAFVNGQLGGVMGLHREGNRKRAHKALVWGVYVEEAFRGEGVAPALMAALIGCAEKWDGLLQLMLSVEKNNEVAKRLYASFGFQSYAIEPRYAFFDEVFYDEEYMIKYLKRRF